MYNFLSRISREALIVYVIILKNDPIPMNEKEIADAINASNLLEMTDAQLESYANILLDEKAYLAKARLN
jgi:hypothetical protein